jgi:hypothetical protein
MPYLPAAALLLLTAGFYSRLWWPGQILLYRDAYLTFPPVKQYLVDRLAGGDLPQWYPYEGLGLSYIGVVATGVFHPFSVLYFIFSAPQAYRISALISCLLAAFGTFCLGRRIGYSQSGACLAAIAFTCSGFVVSVTEFIPYLHSICLLPFFLVSWERGLRDHLGWMVVPAAIWALTLLNGDIQTGYYYGGIALLWAAGRRLASFRRTLLRFALTGALACLVAAVQLGPTWAMYESSNRADPQFRAQTLVWSTHPLRLITLAAWPNSTTSDSGAVAKAFFGNIELNRALAESLYLGLPVLGLAFLGAWVRRDLWILPAIGSLALLLALGRYGGLYDVFSSVIPLWSAFRYPEKLMGFVTLAAALLAGAGLDAARAGRGCLSPWLGIALLCAGFGVLFRTDSAAHWVTASLAVPPELARDVTSTTGRALLMSAGAALAVWIVLAGADTRRLRTPLPAVFLLTIVAADLALANWQAYVTGPEEAAAFVPQLVRSLSAVEGPLNPGRFRVVTVLTPTRTVPDRLRETLGLQAAVSVSQRQALFPSTNALFGIETFRTAMPAQSPALDQMYFHIGTHGYARFNVAYVIGPKSRILNPKAAEGLIDAVPGYDLILFRNPVPPKPRAYLSRKPETAGAPPDPVALLDRADFRSGEVDVIETADALPPGSQDGDEAVIETYAPEEVRIRTRTGRPAVLVLLDAYAPGWRAELEDGTDLPIRRCNTVVRAVTVPAGLHRVTFTYRTPLLVQGAWASGVGLLFCVGMAFVGSRQARGNRTAAGRPCADR